MLATALSPSGLFVACVVKAAALSLSSTGTVATSADGMSSHSLSPVSAYQLVIWTQDVVLGAWSCVGGAGLSAAVVGGAVDTYCPVALDWTPGDSLIVAAALGSSSSVAGNGIARAVHGVGEVLLAMLSAGELLSGRTAEALSSKSILLSTGSNHVGGVRVVPQPFFHQQNEYEQQQQQSQSQQEAGWDSAPVTVVLWSGSKVLVVGMDLQQPGIGKILWTDVS